MEFGINGNSAARRKNECFMMPQKTGANDVARCYIPQILGESLVPLYNIWLRKLENSFVNGIGVRL